MAEVLLYGAIDSYSASDFVTQLNAVATKTEDLTIRICCPGGEPAYTWAMLSKFSEMPNPKKGIIDGKAYSGAAFACLYMDTVECVDVAEGLIHRAAYPDWYESNPNYFDDATKGNLTRINKSLRKAMEAKLNIPLFEKYAGCTMDQLFSLDDRKDVFLTAKQMKDIGLVTSIVKLTPQKTREIETSMAEISTLRSGFKMAAIHTTTKNDTDMAVEIKSLAELKTQFPDIYEAAIAAGVAKEQERCAAWLAFKKIDPKAAFKGIKKGKVVTASVIAEMGVKANSPEYLKALKGENAPNVTTDVVETGETAEAKKKREDLEAFEEELYKIECSKKGKVYEPKAVREKKVA